MAVSIRRANAAEWNTLKAQIMEIENASFPEYLRFKELELEEDFIKISAINLILEEEGHVLGYLNGIRDIKEPKLVYMTTIAVLPNSHRRGLGKMLFEELVKESKKEGYIRLELHATNERIKLLSEKQGCTIKEYLPEYTPGHPAWFMEKALV